MLLSTLSEDTFITNFEDVIGSWAHLETACNGPEIGGDSQTVCANEVAVVKKLNETEIQDWCRATMRMASEAFEQELSRMENSTSTPLKKGGAKKQAWKHVQRSSINAGSMPKYIYLNPYMTPYSRYCKRILCES